MPLEARTFVAEKGRLVIPAAMREALGIEIGDAVDLRVDGNELRISTKRGRILRAQHRIQQFAQPESLASDELSADRREAAKHEVADHA